MNTENANDNDKQEGIDSPLSSGKKKSEPANIETHTPTQDPPLVDRAWFRLLLASLPVFLAVAIAVFAYFQYLHNQAIFSATQEALSVSRASFRSMEWMQRPWVGISTLFGNPGAIGMCLMPEAEYRPDGTCKPKRPDVFSYIKDKERLRGYIQVRNTGNSPAIDTVLTARWCVSSKEPTTPPSFIECARVC